MGLVWRTERDICAYAEPTHSTGQHVPMRYPLTAQHRTGQDSTAQHAVSSVATLGITQHTPGDMLAHCTSLVAVVGSLWCKAVCGCCLLMQEACFFSRQRAHKVGVATLARSDQIILGPTTCFTYMLQFLFAAAALALLHHTHLMQSHSRFFTHPTGWLQPYVNTRERAHKQNRPAHMFPRANSCDRLSYKSGTQ